MAYKSFKSKQRWEAFGDKPVISILSTGLICLNKVCYDTYIKPTNCGYVKLYYNPDEKKIAFEMRPAKAYGEPVFLVTMAKTGPIAIVNARSFLKQCGIKYNEKSRSYLVYPVPLPEAASGYKRKWSEIPRGIEIRLTDEYSSPE
ncbi:MAG: hypothetical protein HZA49_10760 [Planctomycetes bacterium]|nr:hypothetical protein [Planctomycetota bacterium]